MKGIVILGASGCDRIIIDATKFLWRRRSAMKKFIIIEANSFCPEVTYIAVTEN